MKKIAQVWRDGQGKPGRGLDNRQGWLSKGGGGKGEQGATGF
jgi:hypothetical protein